LGLIHELNGAQVETLYGDNLTRWRRVLDRVIRGGSGRAATFRTNFSVNRNLEPLAGCALPAALVALITKISMGYSRGRAIRETFEEDKKRDDDRGGRGRDNERDKDRDSKK
jgi:hypothetical protein